jgi:hypothetical protein
MRESSLCVAPAIVWLGGFDGMVRGRQPAHCNLLLPVCQFDKAERTAVPKCIFRPGESATAHKRPKGLLSAFARGACFRSRSEPPCFRDRRTGKAVGVSIARRLCCESRSYCSFSELVELVCDCDFEILPISARTRRSTNVGRFSSSQTFNIGRSISRVKSSSVRRLSTTIVS